MRILVVEDDPIIREFIVDALRDEGFNVIHAADGEEALAWCGRKVADVLITDISLPGRIDGWQIAERCREQDPDLLVIYATGFSPVRPRPVSGSLLLQKPYQGGAGRKGSHEGATGRPVAIRANTLLGLQAGLLARCSADLSGWASRSAPL